MTKDRPHNVIDVIELDKYEARNICNDLTETEMDFDVQQYEYENEDEFERDFITIDDNDNEDVVEVQNNQHRPEPSPLPQRVELEHANLKCGRVELGDVVELNDPLGRQPGNLPRGDFLLITSIKVDYQTEEVFLYGYKMCRTTHIAPTFNRHINDLFINLYTREGDLRPPFVQGLIEVAVADVLRKRQCVFTELCEKAKCMSDVNLLPRELTNPAEKFKWVFEQGILICRYVYIIGLYGKTGKSYKGEARRVYQRECQEFSALKQTARNLVLPDDDELAFVASNPPTSSSSRQSATRRRQPHPRKISLLTFADLFCGAGGVSDGARKAGLRVHLGLDNNEIHMKSYAYNHPNAKHLCMDAHDFPLIAKRGVHDADHCHFSCPCKYWSIAHSVDGKNDEKNLMTIFTPGPILKKLKPSTISLEQTPGLLIIKKHAIYFRNLVNQCVNRGYNIRWEIQDMAWFGLPQHRPRLIILGAKLGLPIPPLARPTHGPVGSGLQPYCTVHDAFRPLRRRGQRVQNDPHHRPDEEHYDTPKPPYDPRRMLAATITTGGGNQSHYSGLRQNTVREMGLLQGFDEFYHFEGTKTEAREAVGNAWGPEVAAPQLLSCAATKEACESGWIDAEDHIQDLYEHLESRGFKFPSNSSAQANFRLQYRYIPKLKKTIQPRTPLIIFGRRKLQELSIPEPSLDDVYFENFFDTPPSSNNRRATAAPQSRSRRIHRTKAENKRFQEGLEKAFIHDDIIEIESD